MAALTKGHEGSAQKATEVASLSSESSESKRRLPVGACVSSVRVDYESFAVGTGQVSPHSDEGCIFSFGVTYLQHHHIPFYSLIVYSSFMGGVEKTDSNKNRMLPL